MIVMWYFILICVKGIFIEYVKGLLRTDTKTFHRILKFVLSV